MRISILAAFVIAACLAPLPACKPRHSGGGGGSGSTGRSGWIVTSPNEPKNDADALALVGITMSPPPAVEYRKFTAGMDDHMDLVIRFPKERLEAFWKGSKWNKEDSKPLNSIEGRSRRIYEDRVKRIGGGDKNPVLESLRGSTDGIWCDEPTGITGGLKIFLSLDQDPDDVVAYIEWFQT